MLPLGTRSTVWTLDGQTHLHLLGEHLRFLNHLIFKQSDAGCLWCLWCAFSNDLLYFTGRSWKAFCPMVSQQEEPSVSSQAGQLLVSSGCNWG